MGYFAKLPNRPEDLRRLLKRWILDDPARYLRTIYQAERVAERAGEPFLCEADPQKLATEIARAAVDVIRERDITSQTRRRDIFHKNKKRYEQGDRSVPGPENCFGVEDWRMDQSYKIKVRDLGSDRANDIASVSAILLTDNYLDHRRTQRHLSKEREKEELDRARIAAELGKSATRKACGVSKPSSTRAHTGKCGRGDRPLTSATCEVTPSKFSKPSEGLSQFSNWRTSTEDQKAAAMARVILDDGQGLAVTIDLSQGVVDQAKASRKSTMSHLRERLAKLLKRRLGYVPDMVLVGEQGFAQNPHIHGVVDLPYTQEAIRAVRSAGLELSGLAKFGKASGRVVDIQKLYDPEHWVGRYAAKYRHSSRRSFDAKGVIVSTQSLSRRARERQARLKLNKGKAGCSKALTAT